MNDIRSAVRSVRRAPVFAAAVIITVAVGVGATTSVFGVLYGVLLRPLPYEDASRLVAIWQTRPVDAAARDPEIERLIAARALVATPLLEHWRRGATAFEAMAGFAPYTFVLTGASHAERVQGLVASASFFPVLRARPHLGRLFIAGEDQPGRDDVVVLSYSCWRDRFGGDRAVIGRRIGINSVPHTVIGVLAPDFHLVLPWADRDPAIYAPLSRAYRNGLNWTISMAMARLRHDATLGSAQGEMDALMARLGAVERRYRNRGARVVPLADETVETTPGSRRGLQILFGATIGILLIACVNVANLLLVRSGARQRELAVRAALGAGRWRIAREVIVESLLLSTAGGVGGVLLAAWTTDVIVAAVPKHVFPRLGDVQSDATTLLFGLGISTLSGLIAALAPVARILARDRRGALAGELGDSQRSAAGTRAQRAVRRSLVTAEVGVAMVLLVGVGLLARTYTRLSHEPLGVRPDGVLTFGVQLPEAGYASAESRAAFAEAAVERLRALPTVQAVGVTASLPLSSGFSLSLPVTVEGGAQAEEPVTVDCHPVSPGFFAAAGLTVREGRVLNAADARADVAVVNESFQRRFWPGSGVRGASAVGQHLIVDKRQVTVVGIVADVRYDGPGGLTHEGLYLPFDTFPTDSLAVLIRTTGPPTAIAPAVRTTMKGIDAGLPLDGLRTLEDVLAEALAPARFRLAALAAFGGIALVLAVVGLYGVMAQSVSQRTRELGIRLALGAARARILAMVLAEGLATALIGVVLGVGLSVAAGRLLTGFLHGVAATDAWTYGVIASLLIAVAVAACLVPARAASAIDPVAVLRRE